MQFVDDNEEEDHGRLLAGYMTSEEVAAELGMVATTLALWRIRQKGPPYVKIGRRTLYSRLTVREWIASQVRKPGQ